MSGLWTFRKRNEVHNANEFQQLCSRYFPSEIIHKSARDNDFGLNQENETLRIASYPSAIASASQALSILAAELHHHADPEVGDVMRVLSDKVASVLPDQEEISSQVENDMGNSPSCISSEEMSTGRTVSTSRTTTSTKSIDDKLQRAQLRRQEIRELQKQKSTDVDKRNKPVQKVVGVPKSRRALEEAVLKERAQIQQELQLVVQEEEERAQQSENTPPVPMTSMEARALQRKLCRSQLVQKYADTAKHKAEQFFRQCLLSLCQEELNVRATLTTKRMEEWTQLCQTLSVSAQKCIIAQHNRRRIIKYYGLLPWKNYCHRKRETVSVGCTCMLNAKKRRVFCGWKEVVQLIKSHRRAITVARCVALSRVLQMCWKRIVFNRLKLGWIMQRNSTQKAIRFRQRMCVHGAFRKWVTKYATNKKLELEKASKDDVHAETHHIAMLKRMVLRKWKRRTDEAEESKLRLNYRSYLWNLIQVPNETVDAKK